MEICRDEEKKNLGLIKCLAFPQMPRTIITVPDNFVAEPEQWIDPAFWQAKLLAPKSERIYIWDYFVKHEDISEEATYEDTPHAMIPVRDGNYRFRFNFRVNLCKHKAMYTHRAGNGGVLIFDNKRQLLGTEDTGGKLRGLSVQLLHTEKISFNDGSVASSSPIMLALNDNLQVDKDGALIDFSFINQLIRLTDVVITVVSADANDIVLTVKTECDSTPVTGLIAADFIVLDGDGDASAKTLVDNGNGQYTLSATGAFETGTVDLVSAGTLSIPGYESLGSKVVTVA